MIHQYIYTHLAVIPWSSAPLKWAVIDGARMHMDALLLRGMGLVLIALIVLIAVTTG